MENDRLRQPLLAQVYVIMGDYNGRSGDTVGPTNTTIRLAAVGDILLSQGGIAPQANSSLFAEVQHLLRQCDIVFGNLECTLGGSQLAPTEPRVIADESLVRQIGAVPFHVVSLANNHMFDALQDGFHRLRGVLDSLNVKWFGAGLNLQQAKQPVILARNGQTVAFIGAADTRSGPYRFADDAGWGVRPLHITSLCDQIRQLRTQVDHVIVSLHWGEEHFLIPAPLQVEQARQLAQAGATMVLGHHPHVLQGLEWRQNTPVIYSLGNLVACDIPFTDGDWIRWDRLHRTGAIVIAEIGPRGVHSLQQIPTYFDGATVQIDLSRFAQRRIARANLALQRGVSLGRYRREHLWVKTIRPALTHLRWRHLKNLRLSQIRHMLAQAAAAYQTH